MTHHLDQEAKFNMCCIREISDPADGFAGGGSERTKYGNEKTSQKATTVFHRRDDGVLIWDRVDLINQENLRAEKFVIDWMWYYERGNRFLMVSPSTETEYCLNSIITGLYEKDGPFIFTSWVGWVCGLPK